MDKTYTRRRLIQVGGATGFGLTTGLAGCSGGNDSDGTTTGPGNDEADDPGKGSETETTTPGNGAAPSGDLAVVPSGATMVARIDVATLLDSELAKTTVEDTLALAAEQQPDLPFPQSYADVLSQVESSVGLDPRGLQTMTVFGAVSGDGSASTGAVLSAEWSESALLEVIESDGTSVSETQYAGTTLYTTGNTAGMNAIGVLDDGRYAFGMRAAVEAVIDTAAGDAEAVSGAVVDAYADAPGGPIRFGADLADASLGQADASSPVSELQRVSGGVTLDGATASMVVDARTTGDEAAGQLKTMVEEGLGLVQRELTSSPDAEAEFGEAIAQLEEIAVTQDGSTVSVSYSASTEAFASLVGITLFAVIATFVLSMGESPGQSSPQAAFAWDYRPDAGTLEITHQAGDTIPGSALYVRGSTGNGSIDKSWAELGVSEVMAGSSVTIQNVTGAYDIGLVWVSPDGGSSATLSRDEGPDA